MNLHAMVRGIVGMVNANRTATVRRSAGYTVDADGSQVPAYEIFEDVEVQQQPLANDELRRMDGLNIQGNKCAVYALGDYAGLVRVAGLGGDLFEIDGSVWLAVTVLENWGAPGSPDGWVKLALTQQNEASAYSWPSFT